MKWKRRFKLPIFNERYIEIFENYKSAIIEQRPNTEDALFDLYVIYTDPILDFTKRLLQHNTVTLNNEVRAMFGHLSEYRLSDGEDRNELQKAYGHFRRLNIDMFKLLCDEFDKAFLRWLKKFSHYEYRNMKSDFLHSLVQQYLKAHSEYLNAQKQERVGSDFEKHKIIDMYYSAAMQYMLAWELLSKYKKQTIKIKWIRIAKVSVSSLSMLAGIIWTIYELCI